MNTLDKLSGELCAAMLNDECGDGVDIAGGLYGEDTTTWIKEVALQQDKLVEQVSMLRNALINQTESWCELVNSGDAGRWNPEEDDIVIQSRKALELPK